MATGLSKTSHLWMNGSHPQNFSCPNSRPHQFSPKKPQKKLMFFHGNLKNQNSKFCFFCCWPLWIEISSLRDQIWSLQHSAVRRIVVYSRPAVTGNQLKISWLSEPTFFTSGPVALAYQPMDNSRKGSPLHSYSFRMGLEPETSYSREVFGFLGYVRIWNHTIETPIYLGNLL